MGYGFTECNQAGSILNIQLGVAGDSKKESLYNSLIGSSIMLGTAIGSISGGKLI